MDASHIPSFDTQLVELNQFILRLVEEYQMNRIKSWDNLDQRVKNFFAPQKMEAVEILVPGWKKMASYSEGITLTHVMCVFLGLFMLPEFQALSQAQQQLAKWIVLFHDVQKEAGKGKRDLVHGFRSAITTATNLPKSGFVTTQEYDDLIHSWSISTYSAVIAAENFSGPIQDNSKLPEILSGIDKLFGGSTPAALIVKGVLLHMSINVVDKWPQAAPLSEDEIIQCVDTDLLPLLRVMMLADNEGWVMFYPENRMKQYQETVRAFEKVKELVRQQRS